MTNHFNGLTEAEAERLAMLAEEAAEIVQAAMKILRHGYDSYHPNDPSMSNRKLLAREVGNFSRIANLCFDEGDWEQVDERAGYGDKTESLRRFSHHQSANRK